MTEILKGYFNITKTRNVNKETSIASNYNML